jgi:hypothetical protein
MAGEIKRLDDVTYRAGGTTLADSADLRTVLTLLEQADAVMQRTEYTDYDPVRGELYCNQCGATQSKGHRKDCPLNNWHNDYKTAKGE